ncbi:MAG: ATP-binding protein [Planctomycetota bacterium]|jgi:signal transduction histidine kinase
MSEARLTVSGPTETNEILLDPAGMILGRGSDCEIILDDAAVSRHHARISRDSFGRWIIEDLGSQNGVLVDGQRVRAQALVPGQGISVRPFTMVLSQDSDQEVIPGTSIQSTISIADQMIEEEIVAREDHAATLSPVLMQNLNKLTDNLLTLSSPSDLYYQACSCLAGMLNTLVAIVRLPCNSEPLPTIPDILACHFGVGQTDMSALQVSSLHLSRRVLDKVRSTNAPVMANSGRTTDHDIALTIVDEHKPHVVFCARVHDLGETVDALYVDVLQDRSSAEMFDFVEAAARQVDLVQKNLFFAKLQKQEKALREANDQLKKKDRIKDEYVSRVTHDIKGHLATTRSWLYVATDQSTDLPHEKRAEFAGRALGRTLQLTAFVKELLDLTQMRLSGQLQMEPFSLPESISKSLASIAGKAKDKSITVTSDVESSLGEIVGHEFSINEMITNLLFNAVKYTPENKTVHLEARGFDGHVQIDIADTGIGIPEDELANVFDEFFRASNARKSERDGTGLGLSIVKQIVERHGGKISVESRQGLGTKFTVIMPRDGHTTICS